MTKAEIMHCAAILAAGVMANRSDLVFDAERAVDLMDQIANEMTAQENGKKREALDRWLT